MGGKRPVIIVKNGQVQHSGGVIHFPLARAPVVRRFNLNLSYHAALPVGRERGRVKPQRHLPQPSLAGAGVVSRSAGMPIASHPISAEDRSSKLRQFFKKLGFPVLSGAFSPVIRRKISMQLADKTWQDILMHPSAKKFETKLQSRTRKRGQQMELVVASSCCNGFFERGTAVFIANCGNGPSVRG